MSATEPVVMTLREAKEGADRSSAFFNGEALTAISRNGSTMKLARRLVAAGAPDMPVEVWGEDGRLRFTSRSLHALARSTITESKRGLSVQRWQPRHDAENINASVIRRSVDGAEAKAA